MQEVLRSVTDTVDAGKKREEERRTALAVINRLEMINDVLKDPVCV